METGEIVLIALGCGILVLLFVVLGKLSGLKNRDSGKSAELIDRLGVMETRVAGQLGEVKQGMERSLGDFKFDFSRVMNDDFNKMNETMTQRINELNDRVNGRLEENFAKSNETFQGVLQRLAVIDEAQKKIDGLSGEIVSLQTVLTDKKTRGIFGEVNLTYILTNVFGEANRGADKVYDIQHKMSNGLIADAVVFAPEPMGTIAIDSKFPLENYRRMTDCTLSAVERDLAEKEFKKDVKKHINDIASKYIIPGETAGEAIMFLPAEAIFAEINAYHEELVKYAYKAHVWVTSPTTLMSSMSTVCLVLKNIERDKYTQQIHEELNKLSVEFGRYRERWDKLSRSIKTISSDAENLSKTTDKITKQFDVINKVEVKSLPDPAE